ncbi:hypothetical protein NQ318_010773 [Aromia moschata]|uniref:DUF4817 domain-containing protein n=1 Tax=Aromia moschata TaxID=1265417 RepID=A0AAV8YZW4_9CUCU|nr:hypothetical protein NQ318_010773 [Aromia moschata]
MECIETIERGIVKAQRIYSEQYPERRLPHHTTFTNIHQRLREFVKFEKRSHDSGRTREVRTEALEKDVLNLIEESPETSTRKIDRVLNVTIRILKEQQLYAYHLQRMQALPIRDILSRVVFCQWLINMIGQLWFMHDGAPAHFGISMDWSKRTCKLASPLL